jgi:hypothetical protein
MIDPLLSPEEIAAAIESVTPLAKLAIRIRSGEWDAKELSAVAASLDQAVLNRKTQDQTYDEVFGGILFLIGVMFYSKDRFGHSRESEEYRALEILYGSIIAGLGF